MCILSCLFTNRRSSRRNWSNQCTAVFKFRMTFFSRTIVQNNLRQVLSSEYFCGSLDIQWKWFCGNQIVLSTMDPDWKVALVRGRSFAAAQSMNFILPRQVYAQIAPTFCCIYRGSFSESRWPFFSQQITLTKIPHAIPHIKPRVVMCCNSTGWIWDYPHVVLG